MLRKFLEKHRTICESCNKRHILLSLSFSVIVVCLIILMPITLIIDNVYFVVMNYEWILISILIGFYLFSLYVLPKIYIKTLSNYAGSTMKNGVINTIFVVGIIAFAFFSIGIVCWKISIVYQRFHEFLEINFR